MWFFCVLNISICLSWGMDGSQHPQKKLTLRIPSALVQAAQERSANERIQGTLVNVVQTVREEGELPRQPVADVRFLQYDPPEPPPPLPYPVFDNVHDEERPDRFWTPGSMDLGDDDLKLLELGNMDDALEEWLDALSTTPLYLVRFDAPRLRYLTFCESSRKRLIGKYLEYLVSDSTTAEYTTLRSLSARIPPERIKQEGLLHTLLCTAPQCGHKESQLSAEELTVKMILHHMIEHQSKETWYQKVDRRIKESFEEALTALKEESQCDK